MVVYFVVDFVEYTTNYIIVYIITIAMFVTNPHFIYINSRDRINGTDENFTYNINFPSGLDFTHVVCLNVLIPKSYYLIQNGELENFSIERK